VEADLRQPVLNAGLNLNCSTGLSSLLQGEICPDLPVALPELPTLSVIPAGPQTSYPAELLGSPRMKELITEWRGKYEYIFFDTPPALAVTDAAVLASVCDLVVLVARANLTQRPALKRVSTLFARLRPRGRIIRDAELRLQPLNRDVGAATLRYIFSLRRALTAANSAPASSPNSATGAPAAANKRTALLDVTGSPASKASASAPATGAN
jgi:hypothetical protein